MEQQQQQQQQQRQASPMMKTFMAAIDGIIEEAVGAFANEQRIGHARDAHEGNISEGCAVCEFLGLVKPQPQPEEEAED